MESDKLRSKHCSERGYFPALSYTREPILQDLGIAERSTHAASMSYDSLDESIGSAICEDSKVAATRRTPNENEHLRVEQMVISRPDDAVDEIVESRHRLIDLQMENSELRKTKEDLTKDIARLNESLKKVQVVGSISGLTRVMVSSDT